MNATAGDIQWKPVNTRSRRKLQDSQSPLTDATHRTDTNITQLPAHLFTLDVLAYTIEFLCNDSHAVRACTLTSKAWYQIGRRHIYQILVLDREEKCERILRILGVQPEAGHWVRTLRVLAGRISTGNWDGWIRHAEHLLLDILGKLSSVQTLELSETNYHESKLLFSLAGIRSLVLTRGYNLFDAEVQDIVSHFPNLTSLIVLSDVYNKIELHWLEPAVSAPLQGTRLHLQHLDISIPRRPWRRNPPLPWEPRTNMLIPWLQENGHAIRLRTLVLHMHDTLSPSPVTVGCFLQELGATLEELTLVLPRVHVWQLYTSKVNPNQISLAKLSSLRFLHLGNPTHPAVTAFLAAPLPSLIEVTFELQFDSPRSVRSATYASLDKRLCHLDFGALTAVRINYEGKLHAETVTERMKGALQEVSRRGLLRLLVNDS